MIIEVRSRTVPLSETLNEHVVRRLELSLRRYAGRIVRLVVRLVDLNGPRGGPDKRCRITAHLSRPPSTVLAEATDADAYAAVTHAAVKLDERVTRAIVKLRRRPSIVRLDRRAKRPRAKPSRTWQPAAEE